MAKAQPGFSRMIQVSASPTRRLLGSPHRDPGDLAVGTAGVEDGCVGEAISAENPVVVVLSDDCRPLRRQLPALAWMILEQVAMDAVLDDERLLARTSARQVAEQLAINPATAARALRLLRDKGLLVLHRDLGPVGRFGLSVYVLNDVDGLTVMAPDTNCSRTVQPSGDKPHVKDPNMFSPAAATPCVERPYVVNPPAGGRRSQARRSPPPPPSLQGDAQAALDLGLGSV
jgi:hypothetical protein